MRDQAIGHPSAPSLALAGYPTLFGATAAVAIAASLGVWRIRSVR